MEGHGPRIGGNSSAGCIPRFITFFTTCSQRCRQFPKQQTRISMIIGGFLWLLSDMHAQREKQYFYFRLKSWPIWGTFTPCLFRLLLSIPNPNIQRISSIRACYSVYCHLYRKCIPSIAAESPKHYGTCIRFSLRIQTVSHSDRNGQMSGGWTENAKTFISRTALGRAHEFRAL